MLGTGKQDIECRRSSQKTSFNFSALSSSSLALIPPVLSGQRLLPGNPDRQIWALCGRPSLRIAALQAESDEVAVGLGIDDASCASSPV